MANQAEDILKDKKLYDKILKENVDKFSPEFMSKILGLNIIAREDLRESLQHTNEKISDQLSKVTDHTGKTYIIHVEWQSTNDPTMDNRMLVQLRKLTKQFEKAIAIVGRFKIEKDPFYQTGIKKGEAEKSHDVVVNLIVELGLQDDQAAKIAEVPINFVKKVHKELEAKK